MAHEHILRESHATTMHVPTHITRVHVHAHKSQRLCESLHCVSERAQAETDDTHGRTTPDYPNCRGKEDRDHAPAKLTHSHDRADTPRQAPHTQRVRCNGHADTCAKTQHVRTCTQELSRSLPTVAERSCRRRRWQYTRTTLPPTAHTVSQSSATTAAATLSPLNTCQYFKASQEGSYDTQGRYYTLAVTPHGRMAACPHEHMTRCAGTGSAKSGTASTRSTEQIAFTASRSPPAGSHAMRSRAPRAPRAPQRCWCSAGARSTAAAVPRPAGISHTS